MIYDIKQHIVAEKERQQKAERQEGAEQRKQVQAGMGKKARRMEKSIYGKGSSTSV